MSGEWGAGAAGWVAAGCRWGRRQLDRGLVGPRGRDGLWWRVDWVIAGAALVLSLLGALLVWSATRPRLLEAGADPDAYLERHLLNLAIGLALGILFAVVDYRMLRAYAPLIYLASTVGLVAVLVVGTTINGAHSWIVIGGGFQVQPSEFAKVALVMGMAVLLAERRTQENTSRSADVPLVLALAAVPLGLVMLQPDLGTAMVFVFTVLGVLALAGAPARWLLGLILLGVVVVIGAVRFGVLEDYQLERFRAFTNQDVDTLGAAYNITQSRIAIGNGGLTGTGLFDGTQTNGKFVPEQQTDFVFTVAGEELGLLGAGGIVLLFGLLLWRALRLAGRSPDLFGRLVAGGVACLVRVPGVRQHRHDPRHHADHRPAAAVRVVRWVGDVRELDGGRAAAQRARPHPRVGWPPMATQLSESVFPRLEPLLPLVRKPIQYVGGELNSTVKDWDAAAVRWCLMYPDAYEVGLPNQGVMILYELLNERPDALAERTYAVWPDLEALMREHGIPQFTVDAHRPVGAFDVLGVSFSTELGYTNLLTALDLAGIPLAAADRDRRAPDRARRRARRLQPGADRRVPGRGGARRRRAGGRRDHRRAGRVEGVRLPRRAGRAAAAAGPLRRRLRAARSTTSTTCRTAGSSGWCPTGRTCRSGSRSAR